MGLFGVFEQGGLIAYVFNQIDTRVSIKNGCFWTFNYNYILLSFTTYPIAIVVLMLVTLRLVIACTFERTFYLDASGVCLWFVLYLLFVIYPAVSSTIIKTFMYDTFHRFEGDPQPIRALSEDITIDYDSDQSKFWRVYALVMVAVYSVGTLIFFFMCAYAQHAPSKIFEAKEKQQLMSKANFLTKTYKPRFYWFECYELGRKLILTSVFLLINQQWPGSSASIFLFTTAIFAYLIRVASPYQKEKDQALAELSLNLLFVLAFISTLPMQAHTMQILTILVAVIQGVATIFILVLDANTKEIIRQQSRKLRSNSLHFLSSRGSLHRAESPPPRGSLHRAEPPPPPTIT